MQRLQRKGFLAIGTLLLSMTLGMPKAEAIQDATGNVGSTTLGCSYDSTYWYVDISLSARNDTITSVAGTVRTAVVGSRNFSQVVNPPQQNVYDQVQFPIAELGPGTYVASVTGSGQRLEGGWFGIIPDSCSITIH